MQASAGPATASQVTAGYYRFRVGDIACTAISDGPLPIAPATRGFVGAPDGAVERELGEAFLRTDRLVLGQNALVVESGGKRLLIDTGTGNSEALGVRTNVPEGGRLHAHLLDAGIDPASIDVVALTHPHFDHCWGLTTDAGERRFPNAQLALTEIDLDFWTDPSRVGTEKAGGAPAFRGAILNITPYRDRLVMLRDGQALIPGVTALAAPGHTLGHTAYRIASGGESLIHFGDVVHHHVLLLRHPRWQMTFDTDGGMAAETRVRMLDALATDRALAMGYHTPWPGLGHVARQGDAYAWVQTPIFV